MKKPYDYYRFKNYIVKAEIAAGEYSLYFWHYNTSRWVWYYTTSQVLLNNFTKITEEEVFLEIM